MGLIAGILISIFASNYFHGKKYGTLTEDYILSNGSLLKKGTKLKYNTTFPEGFIQYSLYIHKLDFLQDSITYEKENRLVIPYWMEPVNQESSSDIVCDTIFENGDKMPMFEGGDSKLLKYNMNHILPIIGKFNQKSQNIISKLHYSLIISEEGKVIDAEIISAIDEVLKIELETELLKMPNWKSGEVNGESVCMKINIPVSCIKWE